MLRNLPCKRVQVDEIWAFIYAKREHVRRAKSAPIDAGDAWTWTALCADTKLLATFFIGDRSYASARQFLEDLRERIPGHVQITSDGWRSYAYAIDAAFGDDVDYAQLVKIYGPEIAGEKRYSPPVCTGAKREVIKGNPDMAHVSTSYVERQNLTMRMHMRRFTRLTNAFSKKIENHACAVALHAMFYNFVRVHQTLKMTPAMAAGVTHRLWEMTDLVEMLENWEAGQGVPELPNIAQKIPLAN